ncbi:MAG: hypothetical protein HYX47_10430 [Burkholderiales bacterium]|nr:hypothetical protein [Burkholderiales bacterium]
MSEEIKPFRMAIREEGPMVNAYFAKADTMEGAELIASISTPLLKAEPTLFKAFQALMQCAAATLTEQRTGMKVSRIDLERAPEHERAGRA